MVTHWQGEVARYEVPAAYWDSLAGTACKQRPLSLMRGELAKYDIGRTDMNTWDINGRRVQVAGTQGLALQVAGAARAALWREQAKRWSKDETRRR